MSLLVPPPPPGYRNGEGDGPRAGSPARDMTIVHVERVDKERLDLVQAYLSRRGRRPPHWVVFKRLLDSSPLLATALEAERVEREWEARRDRSDRPERA